MPQLISLSLKEARQGLDRKDFTAVELTEAYLQRLSETEPLISACLKVLDQSARERAQTLDKLGPDPQLPLWGIPVTVKDLFNLQGVPTTAGSKMLANYHPSFEATVVKKLKLAGAIILAKTNLDEFAMGSSTEFSAFGPTRNPWNLARVPGGSSGGAAAGISAGQALGALGTDTGGSIRQPAALCGCVGLKPTYGRVSRYGIVAYGSSLDQAGPLTREVRDAGVILQAIAGPDGKDSTCSNLPVEDYLHLNPAQPDTLTLALPPEFWEADFPESVSKVLNDAKKSLTDAGIKIISASLPHIPYSVATYYILAAAEASTNLARYDGVRYGFQEEAVELIELYRKSRTLGLGKETQRRILLGTFVLSSGYYDAYYKKAAQVRRLIQEDFVKTFQKATLILAPVSSIPAWPFGSFTEDPLTQYQLDIMTLPLNLAGLPGISLPAGLGSDGLPVGVQLMGPGFQEKKLLEAALLLEKIFPKLPSPPLK
ncbi:MAG: Asp-tRNA(Asn)/Glu-tRNA(Gln) amidotransferase subunit GatA [Deltaproteobacteria bacterium]|jgi:aspartyl-tRNA(Asn)/glutamyl-tRNA(Gln) amidotransferase subunit A|nr:Asp-tRNA(Asn)/Glu-tRNA(Gln) amidotransferase subunit GatA [Deltaproteobacteria bacterium]